MNSDNILNDPLKMQEVVHAIESMERSLRSVDVVLAAIAGHIAEAEPGITGILSEAERGLPRIQRAAQDAADSVRSSIDVVGEGVDEMLDANLGKMGIMRESAKAFIRDVEEFMDRMERRPIVRMFGSATNFMNSAASSGSGTVNSLVGQLPFGFGALAQLMLKGQSDRSETEAMGTQMLAPFAQTGGSAGILSRGPNMGWEARKYIDDFVASAEDIKSVMANITAGGNQIDDAFTNVGIHIDKFGTSAWETLLGLDKALQVPAGTMASLSSQIQKDTNTTFAEAVSIVSDLGGAAVRSGMDFSSFAAGITQVTQALRMQGGDARDTLLAFTNLQGVLENSGKFTSIRAGQLAMQATSDIGGMISSMPEGLKSVIGQMIAQNNGINLGPNRDVAAINAMNRGFEGYTGRGGQRVQFELEAAQATADYLKNAGLGKDRDEFIRALQVVGHMGPVLAGLMADGGLSLRDPRRLAAAQDEMEKAKQNAHDVSALQTGDYERAMRSLELAMTAVGQLLAGLLGKLIGVTTAGFVAVGQAVVTRSTSPLSKFKDVALQATDDFEGEAMSIVGREKMYAGNMLPLLKNLTGAKYVQMQMGDEDVTRSRGKLGDLSATSTDKVEKHTPKFVTTRFEEPTRLSTKDGQVFEVRLNPTIESVNDRAPTPRTTSPGVRPSQE